MAALTHQSAPRRSAEVQPDPLDAAATAGTGCWSGRQATTHQSVKATRVRAPAWSAGSLLLLSGMDMQRLEKSIGSAIWRAGRPLCARCLTALTRPEHDAENVDVRVVMIHLSLVADTFVIGTACGRCGAHDEARNPVLRQKAALSQ
jgi:hypothetical protein